MENNSNIEVIESKAKELLNKKDSMPTGVKKSLYAILSILLGLIISMIIVAATGGDAGSFFSAIFTGSFGTSKSIGDYIANFSWLLMVGLSVGIALKLGMFNIGVTGQFMLGGITGYFWAYFIDIGRFGVVFSILIPLLTGAFVGWLIGYLKAKHGVHEVLTSIMFNWIIFYLYKMFTNGSYGYNFVKPDGTGTVSISNSSNTLRADWLSESFGSGSQINIGIFIAIVSVVIIWFIFKKTQWGKQVEVTGNNPHAAVYSGFKRDKNIISTMTISGALAGIGGSIYYLGVKEALPSIGSDLPGEAFNGISVALIGFTNIGGMVFASLFMSLLETSTISLQQSTVPEIISVTNAIIIWLVAIVNFFIIYDPISKYLKKSEVNGKKQKNYTIKKAIENGFDADSIKLKDKSIDENTIKTKNVNNKGGEK